jgi:hypothetical protein
MTTTDMLIGIYRKPRLSLDEVCAALNIAIGTGYQQRCRGVFPVQMKGKPLSADVRDVADALDRMRGS